MNIKPRKYSYLFLLGSFLVLALAAVIFLLSQVSSNSIELANIQKTSSEILSGKFDESMLMSNEDWKHVLTAEQYYILREAGTEIPFSGKLNNEKRKGTYYSVGCEKPLFRSEQKYDSGTGWPSFWAPIDENALVLRRETGLNDDRIEVLDTCGGHLGHVFDDGPEPTRKRYCMNSDALYFIPDDNEQ